MIPLSGVSRGTQESPAMQVLLWISSLALIFKVLPFSCSMVSVTPGYSHHWGAQHTLVAEVPIPLVCVSGGIFWQAGGPAVMVSASVTVKTALQKGQQLFWVLSSSLIPLPCREAGRAPAIVGANTGDHVCGQEGMKPVMLGRS